MSVARCRICKKDFYVKPSHQKLGWGKFCSSQCRSNAQLNGRKVICFVCNKEIYRSLAMLRHSKSKKYFCSKSCQTLWRNSIFIEERSKQWNNGIRVYRKIMFRRDLIKKCAKCDFDDMRALVIHHKDHNRNNNNIENLICLCLNCHYLVHHDNALDKIVKES